VSKKKSHYTILDKKKYLGFAIPDSGAGIKFCLLVRLPEKAKILMLWLLQVYMNMIAK
jgi:hypothetical protein